MFGTTSYGGANGYGTVFEIAKTVTGYASTPKILASFDGPNGGNTVGSNGGVPKSNLIVDAAGDLFGTTSGYGPGGYGTVFEIAKTASTPITLVSFNNADGSSPSSLIADAAGDLFGTTSGGGTSSYGTVFEIAKTATGYASTPTTLVNFNYANGDGITPRAGLIMDGAGDLFGTTQGGGKIGGVNDDLGTVFEIAKTATGYASTPTTLVSFNGTDGSGPVGGLIADAAGDLFGTTSKGGLNYGTVFEIAKTATGYASTPTTLASFNVNNGDAPEVSLVADTAGDLFGTTSGGGTGSYGTVFEITNSGFVTATATAAAAATVAATTSTTVAAGSTLNVTDPDSIPNLLDNGTVAIASGGSLDVSSAVDPSSTGVFQLMTKASLEIAAILGGGLKIQFLGSAPTNELIIDSAANFGTHVGTASYAGPLLENFTAGDVIDLKGIASAGLGLAYSAASGDLQITSGGNALATLAFQNSTLSTGAFHEATDGAGGTLITHS